MSDFKKGESVVYIGKHPEFANAELVGRTGVVEYVEFRNITVLWADGRTYGVYPENIELAERRRAQLTHSGYGWGAGTICNVLEGPDANGRYYLEPVGKSRVPLWWDTTEFKFIDGLPAAPFENPPAEVEAVAHPLHYGGDAPYEVIKVAEAWDFDKDAYLFNVLKYIARHESKGKPLEDLRKALWYLERKIVRLEDAQ